MSSPSPAAQARQNAGYTLERAAQLAHISPAYLRQVERVGCPLHLAERLSRLYGGVDIKSFLPQGDRTPGKRKSRTSAARLNPQELRSTVDYVAAHDAGLTESEMEEAFGPTDYRGHGGAKCWPVDLEENDEDEPEGNEVDRSGCEGGA